MLGKILYVSDNIALVEYKSNSETNGDLLNLHLIFENKDQKILGEIVEIKDDHIMVKFLGAFENGHFVNGLLRKANLNCKIRSITADELKEIVGVESKENLVLGGSALYKGFNICPNINQLFSNHLCIFGNSGSGKSCGVARIVQNILSNKNSLMYNANLIFFDSFGEYKNAFKSINTINSYYNYKYLSNNISEEGDEMLHIPMNLLIDDDIALLLQAEKHSQVTIIERAIKYAKIFSVQSEETTTFKNAIIARALLNILYSNTTTKEKKDEIFRIIDICHTNEFNFNTQIVGEGFSRKFSDCFLIDSHGRFSEEVLINNYILSFLNENLDDTPVPEGAYYSLEDLANSLEFTLISDGFIQNQLMHDDAQLLKVRLHNLLNSNVKNLFDGKKYLPLNKFITELISKNGKKAQIINISLNGLDDIIAKSIVKIISRMIYEFARENTNRATVPFHLFLEEAHRYIQHDNDIFLFGYNIFDRIAKEGRKQGVLLDIISQRPYDISDNVLSQCSNFLIFKMTHPKDINYIGEILPNISQDVLDKMKILQPGTCVAFGSAFKIPMICKLTMPNPSPLSSNCNVSAFWDSQVAFSNDTGTDDTTSNSSETTINEIENF